MPKPAGLTRPTLNLNEITNDRRAPRRALVPRDFVYSTHPVEREATNVLRRVYGLQTKPARAAEMLQAAA